MAHSNEKANVNDQNVQENPSVYTAPRVEKAGEVSKIIRMS